MIDRKRSEGYTGSVTNPSIHSFRRYILVTTKLRRHSTRVRKPAFKLLHCMPLQI